MKTQASRELESNHLKTKRAQAWLKQFRSHSRHVILTPFRSFQCAQVHDKIRTLHLFKMCKHEDNHDKHKTHKTMKTVLAAGNNQKKTHNGPKQEIFKLAVTSMALIEDYNCPEDYHGNSNADNDGKGNGNSRTDGAGIF